MHPEHCWLLLLPRSEIKKKNEDELIGLIMDIWINKLQIYYTWSSCTVKAISGATSRIF